MNEIPKYPYFEKPEGDPKAIVRNADNLITRLSEQVQQTGTLSPEEIAEGQEMIQHLTEQLKNLGEGGSEDGADLETIQSSIAQLENLVQTA